jgi:hypothetical protein
MSTINFEGFETYGETVEELNGTVCTYRVTAKYVLSEDIKDVLNELKIKVTDPEVLGKLPSRVENAVVFKVRSKCCDYECSTIRYFGIIKHGEHYLLKIRGGNYELYHNEDELDIRHFIDRLNGIKVLFTNGLYDSGEVVLHDFISMLKDRQIYPPPRKSREKPLTVTTYEGANAKWTRYIIARSGYEIVRCLDGDSEYIDGELACGENTRFVLVKKHHEPKYALYGVESKTIWCDPWDPDCSIVEAVRFKFRLLGVFNHEPSDTEINTLIQQTQQK